MSTKRTAIWKAEPHTIAKIEMLQSYLFQWFSILGTRFRGKDLWYVDGFAGPGEYTNYSLGSPIAALSLTDPGNVEMLSAKESRPRSRRPFRCKFCNGGRAVR